MTRWVVCPNTDLIAAEVAKFRRQLMDALRDGCTDLVVDLSGVGVVDSAGLGALVFVSKAARRIGGDLRVAAPNEQVAEILEITNLDKFLMAGEGALIDATELPLER
jgi:anti-sigma B factor antagonist